MNLCIGLEESPVTVEPPKNAGYANIGGEVDEFPQIF